MNTKEQKEVLYNLLYILDEMDSSEALFRELDPQYADEKRSILEWTYKKQLDKAVKKIFNTNNARILCSTLN